MSKSLKHHSAVISLVNTHFVGAFCRKDLSNEDLEIMLDIFSILSETQIRIVYCFLRQTPQPTISEPNRLVHSRETKRE